MQLRVARLCLDCEELHSDKSCPRCASESFVFLSSWLPVEERRRWKRSPVAAAEAENEQPEGVADTIARWVKGPASAMPDHPTTRASDHVVHLKFDDEKPTREKRQPRAPGLEPHPSKNR